MSWLARSIANTLQLDVDDDDNAEQDRRNNSSDEDPSAHQKGVQDEEDDSPLTPGRGVKEDLSEITKTLTRQFWGVASFLAPPPPAEHSNKELDPSDPEEASPEAISRIRKDFAEIGGRFRSGISKLSSNIDVSEFKKLASNFLQLSPEGDDYVLSEDAQAIGVTDEVVAFVRDITMHPETWLDFPLPEDEYDDEDFELSDAQQEHALTVESLAPRLAALRIELCPAYMSEYTFWKIYFVLLHPRLEPNAAELLSTPEIVKARASLRHELKERSTSQIKDEEVSRTSFPYSEHKPASSQKEQLSVPSDTQSELAPFEKSKDQSNTPNLETEKHPIPNEDIQIIDKSVIQEEPRNKTKTADQTSDVIKSNDKDEDEEDEDADDWLKEEDTSENVTGTTTIPIENDEEVSFSDLEEDDGDAPTNYKKSAYGSDSSAKDSRDWVQLGRNSADSAKDSDSSTADHGGAGQVSARNSEMKESNDWLDVDDIDVA